MNTNKESTMNSDTFWSTSFVWLNDKHNII